jgi:hypothetical protein
VPGFFEHGNIASGPLKVENFLLLSVLHLVALSRSVF